jgi:hypothetical protein
MTAAGCKAAALRDGLQRAAIDPFRPLTLMMIGRLVLFPLRTFTAHGSGIPGLLAHRPGARTTAVGSRSGRNGEQRSGLGSHCPAGTGRRIRSAHHLVRSNCCRALGTLGRPLQRTEDLWSGLDQVRPLRAGERQNAELFGDWKAKTGIDQGCAVRNTWQWAIETAMLY